MFRPILAISFALISTSLPLSAEITADTLWDVWQSGDRPVEARLVDREAGTLVLEGVTFRGGAITYRADRMTLADREDGRVAVAIEGPIDMSIRGLPEGAVAMIDPSDAEILVDRDGDDLTYDIDGDGLTATLSGMGPSFPTADYRLVDLKATFVADAASGALRDMTASVGRLLAQFVLPDGPGTDVDLKFDGLTGGATWQGDRDYETQTNFDALTIELESVVLGEPLDVTLRAGKGQFSGGLADLVATTQLDLSDVLAVAKGDAVPRDDGAATMKSLHLAARVPAFAGTDPVPVSLEIDARDVVPTAAYWTRLDPDAVLTRDPMQVHLAMSGHASLPQAEDAGWAETVSDLTIDRMRLSGLGTEITGKGQVEMPMSPRSADGTLSFVATGLLDTIGALGKSGLLLPGPELGARMGLAFATMPNPDGDGLLSKVKFGPDGTIRMNEIVLR
ncbi:DUF2125 domain-containing protein [Palleronia sp. LCG004]|uniref:DUF2125 domain-containing protein n=1 Tax=Palleronia sp. LCG004 TaxID=3079304 RepID=UPI002943D2D8|nr:DUF2125 domain-containing protein [Palleronia sp. LCG004]WOI56316.1 DUF2125 domain-containing protein [Palleronia sp. LCG004]